jgi:hypothetical protein
MEHHDQNQFEDERLLCGLCFHNHSPSVKEVRTRTKKKKKKMGNLEAGANTEAMMECCLLACSSWLAQPALL